MKKALSNYLFLDLNSILSISTFLQRQRKYRGMSLENYEQDKTQTLQHWRNLKAQAPLLDVHCWMGS